MVRFKTYRVHRFGKYLLTRKLTRLLTRAYANLTPADRQWYSQRKAVMISQQTQKEALPSAKQLQVKWVVNSQKLAIQNTQRKKHTPFNTCTAHTE